MRRYYCDLKRVYGFDWYCDIAERIAKAREEKGWTQAELARASGLAAARIGAIERATTRIVLDDMKKIGTALGLSADRLIGAELDAGGMDCRYLVGFLDGKYEYYQDAPSGEMAALLFYDRLRGYGFSIEPRDRFSARLVGVSVTKAELQARFPMRKGEYDALQPDERKEA